MIALEKVHLPFISVRAFAWVGADERILSRIPGLWALL